MSNIFQKVGNCKVEAKFDASSPLSYGNVREAVPAIGKAVKQEFKDTIAASDANQEFKDAIAAEPVAKKDISNKNKAGLRNLAAVDKNLRDESYYNKVKELSGADVVMTEGVAKKRKCKKKKY